MYLYFGVYRQYMIKVVKDLLKINRFQLDLFLNVMLNN